MPNTVSTFVTDVVNITPTAFTFKRKAICFLDDRGTQVNGLKNAPCLERPFESLATSPTGKHASYCGHLPGHRTLETAA